MTNALRVIDTGIASGRWNTASSFALLSAHAQGLSGDVVRVYRFSPCVLLGASQDARRAVDLDACRDDGVEIARRVTGGGSVYMSPEMLAWDIVTARARTADALCEMIGTALARGLNGLGIAASYVPPAALALAGRKISGAATTSQGRSILHQGTLIERDATAGMARALGLDAKMLATQVTSIAAHGPVPGQDAVTTALAAAFAEALGLACVASRLTEEEARIAEREYARELGSDAHAFGRDWVLAEPAR